MREQTDDECVGHLMGSNVQINTDGQGVGVVVFWCITAGSSGIFSCVPGGGKTLVCNELLSHHRGAARAPRKLPIECWRRFCWIYWTNESEKPKCPVIDNVLEWSPLYKIWFLQQHLLIFVGFTKLCNKLHKTPRYYIIYYIILYYKAGI